MFFHSGTASLSYDNVTCAVCGYSFFSYFGNEPRYFRVTPGKTYSWECGGWSGSTASLYYGESVKTATTGITTSFDADACDCP